MPLNPEISLGPIHVSACRLFLAEKEGGAFELAQTPTDCLAFFMASERLSYSSPAAATLLKPSGPFISHRLSPPR